MSDLAKRLLRKHNPTFVESINGKPFQVPVNPDGAEAAALIEAQDERIKALEAALRPFSRGFMKATACKDWRRAASLLEAKP